MRRRPYATPAIPEPMRRADLLRRRVEDIELRPHVSVDSLLAAFDRAGGFTAKKVAMGAQIVRDMVRDRARAGGAYYHGAFEMDDAALRKLGVHRLGNVLVPKESYGPLLEQRVQPVLRELWDGGVRAISTRDLVWEFGRRMKDRKSLLYWAARNRIPVFVPAILDGAFGSQLWSFWQDHREFRVDEMADEQALAGLVFTAKRTGALVIGGGGSKHHPIWWNQFRDGLPYPG